MSAINLLIASALAAFNNTSYSPADRDIAGAIVEEAHTINERINTFIACHAAFTAEMLHERSELAEIVIAARRDLVRSYEGGKVIWKAC